MTIYLRGAGGAPGIALGRAVRYVVTQAAELPPDADADAALARFSAAQTAAAALQAREMVKVNR